MYTTFKRLISKHSTAESIIAWKGFLIGLLLSMLLIGPTVTLILIFVFKEHNNIDDMIVEYINNFINSMINFIL